MESVVSRLVFSGKKSPKYLEAECKVLPSKKPVIDYPLDREKTFCSWRKSNLDQNFCQYSAKLNHFPKGKTAAFLLSPIP